MRLVKEQVETRSGRVASRLLQDVKKSPVTKRKEKNEKEKANSNEETNKITKLTAGRSTTTRKNRQTENVDECRSRSRTSQVEELSKSADVECGGKSKGNANEARKRSTRTAAVQVKSIKADRRSTRRTNVEQNVTQLRNRSISKGAAAAKKQAETETKDANRSISGASGMTRRSNKDVDRSKVQLNSKEPNPNSKISKISYKNTKLSVEDRIIASNNSETQASPFTRLKYNLPQLQLKETPSINITDDDTSVNLTETSPLKSTRTVQTPLAIICPKPSSRFSTSFVNLQSMGASTPGNQKITTKETKCGRPANKNVKLVADSAKQKAPRKRVQFENAYIGLRPRKANTNYNTSQKLSEEEQEGNCDARVPVYKQAVHNVGLENKKKQKDVYKFESSQSDSDNDYDREMVQELKDIKRMERKYVKAKKAIVRLKKQKSTAATVEKQKVTVISNIEIKPTIQQNAAPNDLQDNNDDAEFFVAPDSLLVFKKPKRTDNYDDFQRTQRPTANSTMLQLSPASSSPWRPHLTYRNGPHILQTKNTSLPAFNQEMVLNSTMVEGHQLNVFNSRLSAIIPKAEKTEQRVKVVAKKSKQTSILTFIPGMEPLDDELHPDMNCTLFDENLLFSPVKLQTNKSRLVSVSPDSKRVLRDRSNFIANVMNTPERESSDVEFFALSASVVHVNVGKPTRFVPPSPKPKVEKIDVAEREGMHEEAGMPDASLFESPASQSTTGDKNNQSQQEQEIIGIFEEYEDLAVNRSRVSFTYARKRKRVRRASYMSNHSDDEDNSHDDATKKRRRKKKGEMTKKEQHDFDKWAESFNAMCDQVDKYELEVE